VRVNYNHKLTFESNFFMMNAIKNFNEVKNDKNNT